MSVRVRKRPDRAGWWVFITHKGKRCNKGFQDKKVAEAFAAKMRAEIELAKVSGQTVGLGRPTQALPTVKEYLESWLTTYAEVHCKTTTAKGYRQSLERYVYRVLGDKRLSEVTRADVKQLIACLVNRGLNKQTVHNVLTPLKEAYNHAMDDGLTTTNPVARTGRLTRSKQDRRTHVQPLTREEVQSLLAVAQEKCPVLYPLVLCAVRTGLRQGELIGLQWRDVDFRGRFIEVRRAVARRQLSTTKSHKIRRVDMSPRLARILRDLKVTRELEAAMASERPAEWVFLSPEGQRWDDRNLRRTWYALLEAAEIREVRFHDLRHTYASLMAESGAPPKYVQEQLGHSSIEVTMDIYSHLFPGGNREWVVKLDEESGAETAPKQHPTGSEGEKSGVQEVGQVVDGQGE